MKRNLLFLLMALFVLNACDEESKDEVKIDSEYSVLNKEINNISNQLGIKVKGEVLSVSTDVILGSKLKSSFVKSELNSWDVENVTIIEFKDENGIIIKNTMIPLKDSPWTMCSIVERDGQVYSQVLDFVFDEENSTTTYFLNESISPINPKTLKSWGSRWMDCMGNIYSSHVGVMVTTLSVAAGVGCVPCGGVAAFYTGVAALGCAGG
ncbi:hypothetical protein ACXR6G_20015 [Ancylomarina sp. YFZ004]